MPWPQIAIVIVIVMMVISYKNASSAATANYKRNSKMQDTKLKIEVGVLLVFPWSLMRRFVCSLIVVRRTAHYMSVSVASAVH